MEEQERLTGLECEELFAALFPGGPAAADVLAELAPDGWERSELVAVAHPSVEILYEEAVRLHRNLLNLPWRRKEDREESPEPTMEEVRAQYKETPVDAVHECAEIVGRCVWDTFSDNHEVMATDGCAADIGSFRGAGGFIADWLNGALGARQYDYMDFYMGTIWAQDRADLSPVYRMIFRKLKARGCDWKYSFPRLGVVRMGNTPDESDPYDPSVAFEKEQEESRKQKEFEEMQKSLRETYNQTVRESRSQPPPEVVKAYMSIYGRAPEGWPPAEDVGGH